MLDFIIPGTLLIIFGSLSWIIYLTYTSDKFSSGKYLFYVILLTTFLKVIISSEADLTDWDEQYHALVAKNMVVDPLHPKLYPIDHERLIDDDWTFSHHWLHKPPLSMWAIASSIHTFGPTSWSVRIPSILYSMIGIFFIYFLAKKYFKARVAIVSSILFGVHGLFLEMIGGRATTDHVDVFFITSFLGAVYFLSHLKNKSTFNFLGSVLFIAAGFYSKGLMILGAPILIFASNITTTNKIPFFRLLFSTIIGASLYLPWALYQSYTLPELYSYEQSEVWNHLFIPIENHEGGLFFYSMHMRIIFGELIYILIGYVAYIFYRKKDHTLLMLLLWILGPFIFFTLAATKMQSYIMISLPAYAILTAYVCDKLILKKDWFIIGAVLVIGLWFRYSIERIKPLANDQRIVGYEQQIKKAIDTLDQPAMIFQANQPIKMMYYTDAVCFPFPASSKDIGLYSAQGYELYQQLDEVSFKKLQ